MFTYIYDWIKNLVFYLILITMLMQVIPDTDYKKYLRFFAGLVLILLLTKPILGIFQMEETFDRLYHSMEYRQNQKEMEQAKEIFQSVEEEYHGWQRNMDTEDSEEREISITE